MFCLMTWLKVLPTHVRVNRCAIWSNVTGNIQFQFFYKKVKEILKSKILLVFTFLRLVKSFFIFILSLCQKCVMFKRLSKLPNANENEVWNEDTLIWSNFLKKHCISLSLRHTHRHTHTCIKRNGAKSNYHFLHSFYIFNGKFEIVLSTELSLSHHMMCCN